MALPGAYNPTNNPDYEPPVRGGGGGYTGPSGPRGSFGPLGVNRASSSDLFRKKPTQGARFPIGLPELGFPDVPYGGRGEPQIQHPLDPNERPQPELPDLRHAMNPGYLNPYRGIPGFENYQHGSLKIPGDTLSKFFRRKLPAEGFPSRERVGEISNAMQRLQGFHYGQGFSGAGQGSDFEGEDYMKRLLRDLAARQGGGL